MRVGARKESKEVAKDEFAFMGGAGQLLRVWYVIMFAFGGSGE
jgi:hypothetical protein